MAKIRLAFVLLSIISISGISDAIFDPKSVVIKNDLGSGLVLSLRCLSADDDLGNHLVPPGETWGFHFRTTYPGTTLFHCGFKWALVDEKKFNVYNDDVDRYVCTECSWSIQRNGTCLSRNASTTSHCYPWSPRWPTPTPDYE